MSKLLYKALHASPTEFADETNQNIRAGHNELIHSDAIIRSCASVVWGWVQHRECVAVVLVRSGSLRRLLLGPTQSESFFSMVNQAVVNAQKMNSKGVSAGQKLVAALSMQPVEEECGEEDWNGFDYDDGGEQ